MKNTLFIILSIVTLRIQAQNAENLTYRWENAKTYSYKSTIVDDINISGLGINMKDKYTTLVNFNLHITAVDENGDATGLIDITAYSVKNANGLPAATLSTLPGKTISIPIKVDHKGKFQYLKKLYLITTNSSNILILEDENDTYNPPSKNAQPRLVDAWAEFDPRTGKLKPGYLPANMKKTRKIQIREDEKSDHIGVLPYDCLSALELPAEPVSQGDVVKSQTGMYEMEILAKQITAAEANFQVTLKTNKSNDMFEGKVSGNSGDGNTNIELSGSEMMNGIPGMPGMSGMPGMPPAKDPKKPIESRMDLDKDEQEHLEMARAAFPEMNGSFTNKIDLLSKTFKSATGSMTMQTSMMGLTFAVKSSIVLNSL